MTIEDRPAYLRKLIAHLTKQYDQAVDESIKAIKDMADRLKENKSERWTPRNPGDYAPRPSTVAGWAVHHAMGNILSNARLDKLIQLSAEVETLQQELLYLERGAK